MLAIGIILGLVGLGLLCRAVFVLAVHALPVFVAATVGVAVLNSGGDIGSVLVAGLVGGVLIVAATRHAFAFAPGVTMRTIVVLLFLVPAAIAGTHVAIGLASFAAVPPLWRHVAGGAGAVLVCAAAWRELSAFEDLRSIPARDER